jgi:hypothetical protein
MIVQAVAQFHVRLAGDSPRRPPVEAAAAPPPTAHGILAALAVAGGGARGGGGLAPGPPGDTLGISHGVGILAAHAIASGGGGGGGGGGGASIAPADGAVPVWGPLAAWQAVAGTDALPAAGGAAGEAEAGEAEREEGSWWNIF